MAFSPDWAGRIYGTNTGSVFLQIHEGEDGAMSGVLRVNDDRRGITVYSISGAFDGSSLELTGTPHEVAKDIEVGNITVSGVLTPKGEIEGDWCSTIGLAGRFVLFPHHRPITTESSPDQLHIARHDLGPISVSKSEIEEIADLVQKDFDSPVIVTVTGETEQSSYLKKFKEQTFSDRYASVIKIRAQAQEPDGIARIVQVEFGPQFNFVLAQSSDEAWARGKCDMLRQYLKRFEMSYVSLWKRFGIGINQVFFLSLLIFLPGLSSNKDRAILAVGVIAIGRAVTSVDKRIRHASVKLSEGKPTFVERYGSTIWSWSAGVLGSILAGLLLAYLQGWLGLNQ